MVPKCQLNNVSISFNNSRKLQIFDWPTCKKSSAQHISGSTHVRSKNALLQSSLTQKTQRFDRFLSDLSSLYSGRNSCASFMLSFSASRCPYLFLWSNLAIRSNNVPSRAWGKHSARLTSQRPDRAKAPTNISIGTCNYTSSLNVHEM